VLLDDGAGRIRRALVPLFDLLVAMDKPRSGLAWLKMRRGQPGNASQLLRRLGLGEISLTHDAFHELQPWRTAAHLEELLMTCGVLPAADKYLCSFQRWLPGHLAGIADPEHAKTIKLYATWRVLPRLRARAERSHITPSIRRFAAEHADALGYHHKTTTRLRNETGGTWSRYAPGDHGRSPAGWTPRETGDT
jgi:hypothetical protein